MKRELPSSLLEGRGKGELPSPGKRELLSTLFEGRGNFPLPGWGRGNFPLPSGKGKRELPSSLLEGRGKRELPSYLLEGLLYENPQETVALLGHQGQAK